MDAVHFHEGVIVFDVVEKRKMGQRVELGKKTIDAQDFRFHVEESDIEQKPVYLAISGFSNICLRKNVNCVEIPLPPSV
ncbi:MAG: hypothetical protein HWE34_04550 [Methylocystaceae bacterium]|nr:hypothetical protein [Methylocystaceae bacterium]